MAFGYFCTYKTGVALYTSRNRHLHPISKHSLRLSGVDELLDEGKRLLAVLVDVLLVRVGVVAVAAVGVGRVAVRLDDGRASRRALEAARAGSKLLMLLLVLLFCKQFRVLGTESKLLTPPARHVPTL
jgi:hypothetical protein